MSAAASACRARRRSCSRAMPGGVPLASLRRRCAWSAKRWSSGEVCMTRRRCCTALLHKAALLAFSSPMAATDAVMI